MDEPAAPDVAEPDDDVPADPVLLLPQADSSRPTVSVAPANAVLVVRDLFIRDSDGVGTGRRQDDRVQQGGNRC